MGIDNPTDVSNAGLIEQLVKLRIKRGNSDAGSDFEKVNQTPNSSGHVHEQDAQDPREIDFKKTLAEKVVDRCIWLGGHGKKEGTAIAEIEDEFGCKLDYFEKEYRETRPDYETLMDYDELVKCGMAKSNSKLGETFGGDCGDIFGDVSGDILGDSRVPRVPRKPR